MIYYYNNKSKAFLFFAFLFAMKHNGNTTNLELTFKRELGKRDKGSSSEKNALSIKSKLIFMSENKKNLENYQLVTKLTNNIRVLHLQLAV